MRQVAAGSVDAEAIFVGHGITAPEFDWDDYRGVDVKGKVVILFTNEPPSDDPKFFGGPALTYYGRWTYKYEEALRKGAAACLIIHTTPTATYNWEVVRNSWGREDFQVKLSAPALSFAGWLTQDAASKLLALAGYSVDDLLLKANTRGFQPIPLGVRVRASIGSVTRELATRNVAALVRGGDPAVNSELVVYSAHWDHLGMNDLATGDKIYNGAVDNASGCAMLLEIARVWADLPAKPRRSALFLAVTAEESGLLGSAYYAANPLVPIEKTSLAINYDSIYPFGRTRDVVVDGAQRTTFWPQIQSIAARFGLTLAPDPHPERGHYFRSDHFSFAKAGIPAFSVNQGDTFVANEERSLARYKEHVEKNYHQPGDEYRDDWDMANLEYLANFGIAIGMDAANSPALVRWEEEKKAAAAKSNKRRK
jgi:Zn-dependent M28 family amino/carboxypeptidase